MLGKLLKHEIKATARLLLPLYLILVVLTVMDRIVIYLDIFKGTLSVISGLITFLYILSIIAIIAASTILVIYRFYKNLMTSEGYLMFTLPAKSRDLINSKLIVSILWTFVSIAALIASGLFVFSGSSYFHPFLNAIPDIIRQLKEELTLDITLFIVEFIILIIFSMINSILLLYVSIAIGQLFNGHKILGSIGAYIGITFVLQIVTSVASVVVGTIFIDSINQISFMTKAVFPLIILSTVLLSIAYYWVTNYIFKKRLNLE